MVWSGIVEGVTKLGGQWLEGKQKVGEAKVQFQVAKFKALADAQTVLQTKTFDLDAAAVKEAAKTWWDEFLVLIYLMPYITLQLSIWFPTWVSPAQAEHSLAALNDLLGEGNYVYGLILIGVRYLGFRNLLRNFLQARGFGRAPKPKGVPSARPQ